jgi:hypothetical protein
MPERGKPMYNYLTVTWSVSRGRETYGYNICRLDDYDTGQRYRALGGGYDIVGTVFADWLTECYQPRLVEISERASSVWCNGSRQHRDSADALYGMTFNETSKRVLLDGACGLGSVFRVAEAIGLTVQATASRRGRTTGFAINDTHNDQEEQR